MYTTHGWVIPGSPPTDANLTSVHRETCGGPERCQQCSDEVLSYMQESRRATPMPDLSEIVLDDPVNHPRHYTSHPSGVEHIEITRWMNFNLGNVVKYLWRAGIKDETLAIQDLEKARWYLDNEIDRRKNEKV